MRLGEAHLIDFYQGARVKAVDVHARTVVHKEWAESFGCFLSFCLCFSPCPISFWREEWEHEKGQKGVMVIYVTYLNERGWKRKESHMETGEKDDGFGF